MSTAGHQHLLRPKADPRGGTEEADAVPWGKGCEAVESTAIRGHEDENALEALEAVPKSSTLQRCENVIPC